MSKKSHRIDGAADKIIKDLGYHAGQEHVERDLNSALGLYLMDGGRWRAFHALALTAFAIIARHNKTDADFDGVDPGTHVEVPWWAVRAIAFGWMEWRDGQEERRSKIRLGQAFEVERPGQGKPSLYESAQLEDRDRRLALLVAAGRTAGNGRPLKLESVIEDIVNETGLGGRTVWEAWAKYEELATRAFSQLQNKPV